MVKQGLKVHMKLQVAESALVKRIPKDTVVAFGDASLGNHFGHLESTPNKRIKALLKKKLQGHGCGRAPDVSAVLHL